MNKSEFVRHIRELLELDDFKAVGVGAGSVSLVSGNTRIGIGYTKILGGYRLPPQISGSVSFPEVEDVLDKYFVLHKIGQDRNTIHHSSRRFEDLSVFDIYSQNNIETVGKKLKIMIFEDILPFFSKYKTLEDVHSRIIELEIDALASFITNPPHPRIMVIKRLVNANDWESYCEESIEMYKEQSEGKYKAIFEPIYRFLPDLYEELKLLDHPA